ncbi:MAG: phage terminase large subunit family protein, partial [Phycisphaerae bacterium]|nr:phage terminase large subunit family protein [Phycisphaerae bacterium]
RREDGTAMRIDRCLIDANWGQSTELVYAFCRRSPHAARLTPSHGRFVGAASVPFSEFPPRPGERVGLNWRMPSRGHRSIRHVTFDTNFWKSFVFARLAVPVGDPGALTVFSTNAARRQLLAEHLTSEYRVRTFGRGREVDEWRHRPDGGDNHWLDCLVGTAVAASIEGVILEGTYLPRRKRRVWTQAMLDEAKARNRRGSDLSTLPPVPW